MTESQESVFSLLCRRSSLFSALLDGPRTKPELVESLDVSRSTVDRCIRDLEAAGLVERVDGGFGLTLPGRLLFEEYDRYRERAAGVLDALEALAVLPPGADIEAGALRGAEVTLADRTAPYRPVEPYVGAVREAEHIDHISTALGPRFVDSFRDAIVQGGAAARLVLSESVSKRVVTDHTETLATMLDTGRLRLRESGDHPGYSLTLMDVGEDTTVHYLVYADDGLRAHIQTGHPEPVERARALFERYWSGARELSPTLASE
ncbi:helix-turn-helix transcriptional regulator [Halorarius halobius]|uniref:helix-turn-helix transcriptional regulator n=1 Tax=Halorarius halobius TaxID=2962671 RepID=UPI0020CEFFE5|nr:MarR family transcriptional regulator [Halorarius halobius]